MRQRPSFIDDDRAIEGLPIRLVIALIVGVAALSIMMSMLNGVGSVGQTEVTVEIHEDSEVIGTADDGEVVVSVVSEDGDPVVDGRVMISSGSAQLDQVYTKPIGECESGVSNCNSDSNQVGIDLNGGHDLRADQDKGTLEIEILPPSDSDYTDSLTNPEVVVVKGSA